MITIIDKDKQRHNGKLEIRIDNEDINFDIMQIVYYLENYDYDNAIDYAERLIDDIRKYQEEEYLDNMGGGVDVDYKDFLPSDVSWKYR